MDKLNTLISLNEAKKTIDDLIIRVKQSVNEQEETDTRKLLILALSILGALVVVGIVAFAVYKHFSYDEFDEYDDLDELFEDDEEDDDIEEDASEMDIDD